MVDIRCLGRRGAVSAVILAQAEAVSSKIEPATELAGLLLRRDFAFIDFAERADGIQMRRH
jgi:hypothetical protein